MTFEHPIFLVLGIIVIIASFPISRFFKDALIFNAPLGPPGGAAFKPPYNLSALMNILRFAERLGVLFLFTAASGPLSLSSQTVQISRGADIIFILDISPSMACLDMNNRNRFDVARELVSTFAKKRTGDAIGLVGVGRDAILLVPPTVDREALFSRLETLRLGELGDGTALGLGLAVAGLHIGNSSAPRKAVILVTDGENNAGAVNPATGAAIMPELGASFWVIAVGSIGQIPIDYTDPFTKVRRTGLFESRFDIESLKSIADRGNGVFIGAPSADAFTEAFARLDRDEEVFQRSGIRTKTKPLHYPFIIAGLLALLLVRLIRRAVAGSFL